MLIIPAIDLKDGACVRLRKGVMEDSTVFSDDPVAIAKQWVDKGTRRLHLVDLNGAFAGEPVNGGVVEAIAKAYPDLPIQIGGGIRSAETIEYYLQAGVSYVIIGTKAVKEPEFVTEMCKAFPGKIIVGLDAKAGFVATDGWAEVSEVKATDLAKRFEEDGVDSIVYTDIDRDQSLYENGFDPDDGVDANSRYVSTQLLYSYKINPQTLVFLGYSDSAMQDDDLINVQRTDRTLFAKFSYAWQM